MGMMGMVGMVGGSRVGFGRFWRYWVGNLGGYVRVGMEMVGNSLGMLLRLQ